MGRSDQAKSRELTEALRARRGAKFVFLSWVFIFVAVFALDFGFKFIPSPDWNTALKGWFGSVIWTAVLASVFIFYPMLRSKTHPLRFGGNVFMVMFAPVFSAIPAFMLLTTLVPASHAVLSLKETSFQAKVIRPKARSRWHCRNPIGLADIPVGYAKICNVPPKLRNRLRRGSIVTVSGTGSQFGVFFYTVN